MDKKFFTIDEVNQLIPQIEQHVRKMLENKRMMALATKRLRRVGEAPQLLDELPPDPRPQIQEMQEQLRGFYRDFKSHVLAIENLGGRIKDFELGRVEFLSHDGDRIVSLIWQLGVTSHVHSEDTPLFLVPGESAKHGTPESGSSHREEPEATKQSMRAETEDCFALKGSQ